MFGQSPAPGWFQKEMKNGLSVIMGLKIFYDDIRVGGRKQAEHDERLRFVLSRLKNVGLTLKISKFKFSQNRIEFLGYGIDASGIHMLDKKVEAVLKIPSPQNVK